MHCSRLPAATPDDIHVLVLVKKPERYIFLFDSSQEEAILRTLGRFATNPELSLTWRDAAAAGLKITEHK